MDVSVLRIDYPQHEKPHGETERKPIIRSVGIGGVIGLDKRLQALRTEVEEFLAVLLLLFLAEAVF